MLNEESSGGEFGTAYLLSKLNFYLLSLISTVKKIDYIITSLQSTLILLHQRHLNPNSSKPSGVVELSMAIKHKSRKSIKIKDFSGSTFEINNSRMQTS